MKHIQADGACLLGLALGGVFLLLVTLGFLVVLLLRCCRGGFQACGHAHSTFESFFNGDRHVVCICVSIIVIVVNHHNLAIIHGFVVLVCCLLLKKEKCCGV